MLLKQGVAVVVGVFVLSAPSSGRASLIGDIVGFPVKLLLGSTLDKAQGNLQDAVSSSIVKASAALTEHETRISDLANQLVVRADNVVEASVLRVKTGLDDSVARALSKVDGVGQDLIARATDSASHLVDQINADVLTDLNRVDTIVQARSADINQMVDERTAQIDSAVADRIAQIDEVVGRRLGDVDVIASQQRIALESTIIRVAVMIGVVVFIVFVIRNLLERYEKLKDSELKLSELGEKRGARRTAFLLKKLTPGLLGPTLAACCGVTVLGALYRWLPSGAVQEAQDLVRLHQEQFADSVKRIDYPRARFEASHLGYLDAQNAAYYEGQAAKTSLLRDVIARPALVATQLGVAAFTDRLAECERLLGPRPDPDLLTLRAMLVWKTGATRRAEHQSASLAARALELSPGGFAFAPLARAYVETFLNQPYVSPVVGEGRDAASLDELSDALAGAAADPPDSPLAGLAELASMMRNLELRSTESYVKMAEANAQAVLADERKEKAGSTLQLGIRSAEAKAIVSVWQAFDEQLEDSERVKGGLILSVFGLDDAILSRALWFAKHPESKAPQGKPILALDSPLERVQLAPARVAWTRRYGELLTDPVKQVFEWQEAKQFQNWERWAIEFEDALVAYDRESAASVQPGARWRAVVAAAALGLYVEGPQYRVPLARTLAGDLSAAPKAPPEVQRATPAKSKPGKPDEFQPRPVFSDAPTTLEELISTRGPRLI